MLRGRGGRGRGSCVSRKRQAKQAVALGCGMCGLCVCVDCGFVGGAYAIPQLELMLMPLLMPLLLL